MKNVLIIVFLFFKFISVSQISKVDSLLNALKHSKNSTSTINILNKLAFLKNTTNPDSSLILANQALALSEKINDIKLLMDSYNSFYKPYVNKKNQTKALEYLQLELSTSKNTGIDSIIANRYFKIGVAYRSVDNKEKSVIYYDSAVSILNNLILRLSKNDTLLPKIKKIIINAYSRMGVLSWEISDLKKALDYQIKALNLSEELKDKRRMSSAYNNLGTIYVDLSDYEKAEKNILLAIKYCEEYISESKNKLKDNDIFFLKINQANAYNNLGTAYQKKVEKLKKDKVGEQNNNEIIQLHDNTLNCYFKALAIYEDLNNTSGIDMSYQNIGDVYLQKGDNKNALDYLNKALIHTKQSAETSPDCIGCIAYYIQSLLSLGNYHLKFSTPNQALPYLVESVTLSKKINDKKNIMNSTEMLSKTYFLLKNYKLAYENLNLFTLYKDSIFNAENSQQIAEIQTKFETSKKDNEILVLNKEKEKERAIADERSKKQRTIITLVSIGLILVLVLSSLVYRSLSVTKRQKNIIEKQKLIVEEKQKEVMDSIKYAKRIQQAHLPNEKFIERILKRRKT